MINDYHYNAGHIFLPTYYPVFLRTKDNRKHFSLDFSEDTNLFTLEEEENGIVSTDLTFRDLCSTLLKSDATVYTFLGNDLFSRSILVNRNRLKQYIQNHQEMKVIFFSVKSKEVFTSINNEFYCQAEKVDFNSVSPWDDMYIMHPAANCIHFPTEKQITIQKHTSWTILAAHALIGIAAGAITFWWCRE